MGGRLVAAIATTLAALSVDFDIGLRTRTVIVQVGIEVRGIELLDAVRMGGIDVAPTDVFADDGAVLGLHQAIVIAVPGPAFGLLDHQLVQQLGHSVVDELAAVIRVKTMNDKGKLGQDGG